MGWCCPLDRAAGMHQAGLDEMKAQLVLMNQESDAAFEKANARVRELPLPALAMGIRACPDTTRRGSLLYLQNEPIGTF